MRTFAVINLGRGEGTEFVTKYLYDTYPSPLIINFGSPSKGLTHYCSRYCIINPRNVPQYMDALCVVRDLYWPKIHAQDLKYPKVLNAKFGNGEFRQQVGEDCKDLFNAIVVNEKNFLEAAQNHIETIILEGAAGILSDKVFGLYPRSDCSATSENIMELVDRNKLQNPDICYVMRADADTELMKYAVDCEANFSFRCDKSLVILDISEGEEDRYRKIADEILPHRENLFVSYSPISDKLVKL